MVHDDQGALVVIGRPFTDEDRAALRVPQPRRDQAGEQGGLTRSVARCTRAPTSVSAVYSGVSVKSVPLIAEACGSMIQEIW
ncbi:hypothetical protein ACFQX6_60250 [Streptosporangium lutulentum]